MAKKEKPSVTVHVDCPCCKAELKVDVFKKRVGEPEPVEYDITTTVRVERQGRLFEKPDDDEAATEAA